MKQYEFIDKFAFVQVLVVQSSISSSDEAFSVFVMQQNFSNLNFLSISSQKIALVSLLH